MSQVLMSDRPRLTTVPRVDKTFTVDTLSSMLFIGGTAAALFVMVILGLSRIPAYSSAEASQMDGTIRDAAMQPASDLCGPIPALVEP